jgi:hypothetical protein
MAFGLRVPVLVDKMYIIYVAMIIRRKKHISLVMRFFPLGGLLIAASPLVTICLIVCLIVVRETRMMHRYSLRYQSVRVSP